MAGSSASLATTLTFLHVPIEPPGSLRHTGSEGAEAAVVVLLHTPHRLSVRQSRLSYVSGLKNPVNRTIRLAGIVLPSLLAIGADLVAPGQQTINHHP